MTSERAMAEALEGKFYTHDKDGHVVDLNYKPPAPLPPAPRDFIQVQSGAPIVRMTTIIKLVCHHFNVPLADLRSARRDRRFVLARQAACYLARKYTSLSFPYIGRQLGRRDHTTVIHGNKMVEQDKSKYQPALSYCIADIFDRYMKSKQIQDPQPAASPHPLAVEATGAVPQASVPVAPPISRVLP